jgi:hypothetical protein
MTNLLQFPKPDDDYWYLITFDDTNKLSSIDLDNYYSSLLPIEKRVYDIINSINGIISFNINFASKFIDFDEIIKSKVLKQGDQYLNELVCSAIVGFSTFIRFPAGVVNYHPINEPLFQVSGIEFMMNKGSFPIEYIDELFQKINNSGKTSLFKTIRSSGDIQNCLVLSNSSIFYKPETDENFNSWRISVSFNDQSYMNPQQIEQDNKDMLSANSALLSKSIYIKTFMQLNNISQITLDKTRFRNDIMNSFTKTYDNLPEFVNFDGFPDSTYLNNIEYIQNKVVNYYLEKLEEYTNCVKEYLLADDIKTIII